MIAPQALPPPPRRSHRRARAATHRRQRRRRYAGYVVLARIALIFAVALVPVMTYVMLMGNVTALNYALAQAQQQKLSLQAESERLDDRIAQLESRERLAHVAAQLHLHDPATYAVVEVPPPAVPVAPLRGLAFLGTLFSTQH